MKSLLRWKRLWLTVWIFGMSLGLFLSLMLTTPRQEVIPHLDKLIHGSAYAMLAIFAICIFEQNSARYKAIIWLIVFGGLIELVQGYLPTGRSMEFADFIANTLGIGLGVFIARRWNVLLFIERKLLAVV